MNTSNPPAPYIRARRTFPGLRCQIGDWVYYVTAMRFEDIAAWVKRTDEIYQSEELRDLVQRAIDKRVEGIVEYLLHQPEKFFNAVVLGIYEGAPQWYPVEVGGSIKGEAPEIDDTSKESLGILALDGSEKVFAIDGQHRIEAIKEAILKDPFLQTQDLAVIFVSHNTSAGRKARTRRLFSTLNKHAKPVKPSDIIALDEDDAFAVLTRRLVEEYRPLRSGFVNRPGYTDRPGFVLVEGKPNLPVFDGRHLTTILVLYSIVETLAVPLEMKGRRARLEELRFMRPNDDDLDEMYNLNVEYWKALADTFPSYAELFESHPDQEVAARFRKGEGHLLFRPIAQRAFAQASRVLMDRGRDVQSAVETLSRVPLRLGEEPWLGTLWDPGVGRVNNSLGVPFIEAMMLYLVGETPRKTYGRTGALLARYRKLLGDPDATLPNPLPA